MVVVSEYRLRQSDALICREAQYVPNRLQAQRSPKTLSPRESCLEASTAGQALAFGAKMPEQPWIMLLIKYGRVKDAPGLFKGTPIVVCTGRTMV